MPLDILITFIVLLTPVVALQGLSFIRSKMFSSYSMSQDAIQEISSEKDECSQIAMVKAGTENLDIDVINQESVEETHFNFWLADLANKPE